VDNHVHKKNSILDSGFNSKKGGETEIKKTDLLYGFMLCVLGAVRGSPSKHIRRYK